MCFIIHPPFPCCLLCSARKHNRTAPQCALAKPSALLAHGLRPISSSRILAVTMLRMLPSPVLWLRTTPQCTLAKPSALLAHGLRPISSFRILAVTMLRMLPSPVLWLRTTPQCTLAKPSALLAHGLRPISSFRILAVTMLRMLPLSGSGAPHYPAVRARKAFGFTRSRASPYQLFQNPRGDHAPHAPLSGSVRSGTAHCFRGHYNIGVGVFKVFFFGSGKHAAGHSSGHAQ